MATDTCHLHGGLCLLGPKRPGQSLSGGWEGLGFPTNAGQGKDTQLQVLGQGPATLTVGKDISYLFWSALGNHRNGLRAKATWLGLSSQRTVQPI